jgi:ketosteroid isomerase-like protein
MLTRDEALALFDRRRQAWLREDLDAYLALWAPDMTFASPVHPEPLRGRAAFAELVRRSHVAARPVSFDVSHLAVSDDVVLAEWSIAIEHRDSARRMVWRGMSVCEIRDGLITRWREYWNPQDVR